jgi:preprotein translocase subunit SecD
MVTCSSDGTEKFILGPAEVNRDQIANATSDHQTTQNGSSNGVWEVVLNFDSAGSKAFCDVTSRLVSLPSPRNQFGIVLDNQVISSPVPQSALCTGTASITGSFTSASAKALAKQLNLGALPLTLQVQSQEQVFGTLSPK